MYNLVGKYLNGYKIVKVEKDPFIKGQINLWTNEEETNIYGDRHIVKFFIREESNTIKVYQELVDKEKSELQQENLKLRIEVSAREEVANKYEEAINKIKQICSSIPNTHSICGTDKIHNIEVVLKEVEND